MTDIRHRMASRHEADFAAMFGVQHPGSGNQARNQGDGRRSSHLYGLGFVWDCKATIGKSISITTAQIEKITEQAGLDKPLLPLRIYANDRLTEHVDLVAMRPDDLLELLQLLQEYRMKDQLERLRVDR